VAFSPDGNRIVSGSMDNTLRLWDVATGQLIGQPMSGHTNVVLSVAFSHDGTRIASGGYDHTVRLWDAATGNDIGQPMTGNTGPVASVAFSPDGTRIVSGGGDGIVRLWPGYADEAALCTKLTANMSHKQWRAWVSPDVGYVTVCPNLPIAPD
jgi:WD40 repeat protein